MKKNIILILFFHHIYAFGISNLTFHQGIIYTNNLFYNENNIKDVIWKNSLNFQYEKNNLLIAINPTFFLLYDNNNYNNYTTLTYLNYILLDKKNIYSDFTIGITINNFIEKEIHNNNEYYFSISNIFYLKNNNKVTTNIDYIKEDFKEFTYLNNDELDISSYFNARYKRSNFNFYFSLSQKSFSNYNTKRPKHKHNNKFYNTNIKIEKLSFSLEYVRNISLMSGISIKYIKNIISDEQLMWPEFYNNIYLSQEWDNDFSSNFDKIRIKYTTINYFNHSFNIEYINKKYNRINLIHKQNKNTIINNNWQRKDSRFSVSYSITKDILLFHKQSSIKLKTLFFKNTSNIEIFQYNDFEINLSISINLL